MKFGVENSYIWYTWKPEEKTLYAFLIKIPDWPRGERREFILKSVSSTPTTQVSVLGHSGELVEYQPGKDAKTSQTRLQLTTDN